MSHDEAIREGLVRLAEPVVDPHGSLERVVASSRRRTRRRRTFGVLTAVVLLAGAVALVAARDEDPKTEVAGVVETAPGTSTAPVGSSGSSASSVPSSSTPAGAVTTTAAVTTATSSTTLVCAVPYLMGRLPDGFPSVLSATSDGSFVVRVSEARSITLLAGAAAPGSTTGPGRSVDLPAIPGTATVTSGTDGSSVADLTVPQGRCGARLHLVTRGLTDAEIDAVLRGLRPDATCSAKDTTSTPLAQGDLPPAVAATRAKLRAAAAACDFEGLAAVVAGNPSFVSEARGGRLADQWRLADGRGNQIMRAVVGLLDLAPRRTETGVAASGAGYVWPSFAADPSTTVMAPADLALLDRVYDPGYGDRFRNGFRRGALGEQADTYLGGIFVEIRADGTPVAITAR